MKARGFTLLELVIVLVLIGIGAVFGTRFIADMATSYVGTAERGQALAGARFAMERIRRELGLAYSPSVHIGSYDGVANRCVSFVPVLASGKYLGQVTDGTAQFIVPLILQKDIIDGVNLAVRADSGEAVWQDYPEVLPDNVAALKAQSSAQAVLSFSDAFASGVSFDWEGQGNRYVLLYRYQVRFCLDDDGNLWREIKEGTSDWSDKTLMLTNIKSGPLFSDYDESLQLLWMTLSMPTREGELVLPSQVQVIYEP